MESRRQQRAPFQRAQAAFEHALLHAITVVTQGAQYVQRGGARHVPAHLDQCPLMRLNAVRSAFARVALEHGACIGDFACHQTFGEFERKRRVARANWCSMVSTPAAAVNIEGVAESNGSPITKGMRCLVSSVSTPAVSALCASTIT